MTWEQTVSADFARARHLIDVLQTGYPVNANWMSLQIDELLRDAAIRRTELSLLDRTLNCLEEAFERSKQRKQPGDQDDINFALEADRGQT